MVRVIGKHSFMPCLHQCLLTCRVRFVMSNIDEIKGSMSEMSKRIRQLEDALQIENSLRTPSGHPLLTEDLLAVKNISSIVTGEPGSTSDGDEDVDNVLAFDVGRLAVTDNGGIRYYGSTNLEVSKR